MRWPPPIFLLVACLGGATASGPALARSRPPVVVELFTAQGCAACPQADRMLGELGARKGVIALTLPVDIWDYVGWADTLAQPAFTDRQRAYDKRLKVREIYTPEIVVNGAQEAPARDKDAVDALILAEAEDLSAGPRLRLLKGGGRVRISPGQTGEIARMDVWMMRYDPQERVVKVKAGDNKGKSVAQRYVVRELTRLGGYNGGTRTYELPQASTEGLDTVVLVQGVRGGRIRGAAQG